MIYNLTEVCPPQKKKKMYIQILKNDLVSPIPRKVSVLRIRSQKRFRACLHNPRFQCAVLHVPLTNIAMIYDPFFFIAFKQL